VKFEKPKEFGSTKPVAWEKLPEEGAWKLPVDKGVLPIEEVEVGPSKAPKPTELGSMNAVGEVKVIGATIPPGTA